MDPYLAISIVLGICCLVLWSSRLRRRAELAAERARRVELETALAVERTRVEERDAEAQRLRSERDGAGEATREMVGQFEGMRQTVTDLSKVLDGTRQEAAKAAAGTARIDGQLLGFTRRLANPQSRGAFGEEALRNQLEHLGLSEGRDFRRQVRESGGLRRIDYALSLRGATIGLDPKFAFEPDLDGLSEALAAGEEERLRPFAKKLVDRAKELAKKGYWTHLERSPSFVLMYVPVEGAQQALAALPRFSYEKFALEHGVYIVTPLQLGTTLGVIADVAHAEKRTEEIEDVHRGLMALDQEMAKFCESYAKHGRQLAATVVSYNAGAAMLSSRGGLGRMINQLRGYSRRLFQRPEQPRFEPVRRDVDESSRRYQDAASESAGDLRESA